jgi:hypothetical protein
MKDADEAVADGAQRLVVQVAGGAAMIVRWPRGAIP